MTRRNQLQEIIDFAKSVDVDGCGTHGLDVSTWEKHLGYQGKQVHDHIEYSKWGNVSLTSLRTHVEAIVSTLTLEHRGSLWPYVIYLGMAITFFIILVHQKKKSMK